MVNEDSVHLDDVDPQDWIPKLESIGLTVRVVDDQVKARWARGNSSGTYSPSLGDHVSWGDDRLIVRSAGEQGEDARKVDLLREREAWQVHNRRMGTDPEYRAAYEEQQAEQYRLDAERRELAWRNQVDAFTKEVDAQVASGETDRLRGEVIKALFAYSGTSDHDYGCASYSEGLACCIDYGHRHFDALLDVIVGAVTYTKES